MRAQSQLNDDVIAVPTWIDPDGEGSKRVLTFMEFASLGWSRKEAALVTSKVAFGNGRESPMTRRFICTIVAASALAAPSAQAACLDAQIVDARGDARGGSTTDENAALDITGLGFHVMDDSTELTFTLANLTPPPGPDSPARVSTYRATYVVGLDTYIVRVSIHPDGSTVAWGEIRRGRVGILPIVQGMIADALANEGSIDLSSTTTFGEDGTLVVTLPPEMGITAGATIDAWAATYAQAGVAAFESDRAPDDADAFAQITVPAC